VLPLSSRSADRQQQLPLAYQQQKQTSAQNKIRNNQKQQTQQTHQTQIYVPGASPMKTTTMEKPPDIGRT